MTEETPNDDEEISEERLSRAVHYVQCVDNVWKAQENRHMIQAHGNQISREERMEQREEAALHLQFAQVGYLGVIARALLDLTDEEYRKAHEELEEMREETQEGADAAQPTRTGPNDPSIQ